MSEKGPEQEVDLNALRKAMQEGKVSNKEDKLSVPPPKEEFEGVNTLEKFEALPVEDQILFMKAKDYEDMELFKNKHFGKGTIEPDINKLRAQIKKEE